MKYREVLEPLKKYPLSNNLFVTGRKSCSTTKGCCSKNKGCRLSDSKREEESDVDTGQDDIFSC